METASEQGPGSLVSLCCDRCQGVDFPVHTHLLPTHLVRAGRALRKHLVQLILQTK